MVKISNSHIRRCTAVESYRQWQVYKFELVSLSVENCIGNKKVCSFFFLNGFRLWPDLVWSDCVSIYARGLFTWSDLCMQHQSRDELIRSAEKCLEIHAIERKIQRTEFRFVCVFVYEVLTGHIVPTNSERYIKYLVSVVIMSFYNLWIIDLFNLALINQRSIFFSASKWKRPIGKTPFSLIWSQLLLLIFACNWILGNNSLFNFYVIAVCSVENIYSNVWNPFGIVWRIQSRLTTQYT